jgi:hypothetical protein
MEYTRKQSIRVDETSSESITEVSLMWKIRPLAFFLEKSMVLRRG